MLKQSWPNDEFVVLVDGTFLMQRSYFAMKNKDFKTSQGVETGALFGSVMSHINLVRTLRPTKMIWFFDSPGGSHARKKVFPEYKGNRKPRDYDLAKQFTAFESFLSTMDVRHYAEDGVESDDLIAHAVSRWDKDVPKVIVSGDTDFHQLVSKNPKISVFNPGQGKNNPAKVYSHSVVEEKYGMKPSLLADAWAMSGDDSDNISGVPRIGFKTARKILETHEWDFEKAIQDEPKLAGHEDLIRRNQWLINLNGSDIAVSLPVSLEECQLRRTSYDKESLLKWLEKWEFSSLSGKEKAIGLYS